jgi:hypothetical protein
MSNARSLSRKVRLCLTALDKFRSTANDHQMLLRIVMNRRPAWHGTEIIAALACLALSAVPQISGDLGAAVASSRNLTATVRLADREFPLSPLSPLGDLRGDWTGTGSDGAKITLTVNSPDALNGTIVFNYPSGKCVESWNQASTDSAAALVDEKPLPASTLACITTQYRVTVDGASLAAKMASGGTYSMVLQR